MTESDEAIMFSNALTSLHLPHWHIENEGDSKTQILGFSNGKPVWGKKWGQINKSKDMGKNPGISDYLVYIPPKRSYVKRGLLLFIELKKPLKRLKRASARGVKGDLVSDNDATEEQLEFIDMVNTVADCQGFVAYGAKDALDIVTKFLSILL